MSVQSNKLFDCYYFIFYRIDRLIIQVSWGKRFIVSLLSEGNRDQKNTERKIIDSILCLLYEKRREDIFVPSDSIVKEMGL